MKRRNINEMKGRLIKNRWVLNLIEKNYNMIGR